MKKIPYAVGNFEQIINDGYHYVDKTRYIAELENWQVAVFLRPRRFGKSLWCSTLECYYDINRKDKFDALFNDTWIGHNPTPLKNSFMVLRINFSVVSVKPDISYIEDSFTFTQGVTIKSFLLNYKKYFEKLSDILTLFWRQRRRDKVLDAVSTAIHGGGAAVNARHQWARAFCDPLNAACCFQLVAIDSIWN
ncbi:AAA family ATPase [Desulfobacter sp.]|uniref:AAA family ATPase n=1 Tax=Desulfobacter sp. TaxID=2294 RepID=UPI003D0A074B